MRASVIADFQYVRMHRFCTVLRKNFAFHLFFSISRQEDAAAVIAQPQHSVQPRDASPARCRRQMPRRSLGRQPHGTLCNLARVSI